MAVPREFGASNDGALGGGQVDGLDANGQSFLQVLQDVTAGAIRRRIVQQLLKWLQLDQDHHVLQEVALYIGRQVWSIEKLKGKGEKNVAEFTNFNNTTVKSVDKQVYIS